MAKNWNEDTEKNVHGVVNEKSKWQAAYEAGDEEGMKAAQDAAKGYYKSLTDSGNYDVAKELQASDYDAARGFLENYKGTKPTDTNRGMATENIRTATDTSKKHSEFAGDFEQMWKEGYQNQEDRINADPMSTEAAKNIMKVYNGLGDAARGDTLADGSVRNDGNLDSFTKANADRQKQAYTDAGVESVFDLHDRNVWAGGQNYRDMLAGGELVGNEYDGAVENAVKTAESATDIENANKQSDVSVQAQEAEITGEVPEALTRKNNQFFDESGKLINPDLDYQEIINTATANGDMKTVEDAEAARAWKIINVPGYSQYVPEIKTSSAKQTEAGRQFDENVRLSEEGNNLAKYEIDKSAEVSREKTAAELYAEAAQYEAMGMPEVAASLRKYADSRSESVENADSTAGTEPAKAESVATAEEAPEAADDTI
ncbi:MAG: hypothetical protein IJ297_00215, partial [Clostridia bacterium]|nr:hypothetical protein [Clostridia bacterium]